MGAAKEKVVELVRCSGCGQDRPIKVVVHNRSAAIGQASERSCLQCARGRDPKPTICRHCKKCKVNRPLGLCWGCYYRPGIRDLYPSTSIYANRGVGLSQKRRPLPEPTRARPGTPEKVAVLEARAEAGEHLWHPRDGGGLRW